MKTTVAGNRPMTARVYPIPEWKKKRVIKMRVEARMSQPEIARATGVHVSTVSAILRKEGLCGRLRDE